MKIFRILLNGLVLFFANFIGIFVGFMVYHFARPANQIAVQLPIAAIISIVLFLAWILLSHRIPFLRPLVLYDAVGIVGTFIASLVWAPIVFVPFHYFTQGYLTAAGNIIAMLLFQLPVNCFIVMITAMICQRCPGSSNLLK